MSRQTKVLDVDPPEIFITATDPFTSKAYLERTGRECGELSFQDVAEGKLPDPPSDEESAEGARKYDLVICSYALHLVPSSSELWALLAHLNTVARYLVVIAPHKKPEVSLARAVHLVVAQISVLSCPDQTVLGVPSILSLCLECR